jgi:2-oxoglutarate dehydrogenase E1 component
LYPLDEDSLKKIIASYPKLKQVAWIQEEPQNMGAWNFLALKLMNLLPDNVKLFYVGRKESAATATGLLRIHLEEQTGLVKQAFEELS